MSRLSKSHDERAVRLDAPQPKRDLILRRYNLRPGPYPYGERARRQLGLDAHMRAEVRALEMQRAYGEEILARARRVRPGVWSVDAGDLVVEFVEDIDGVVRATCLVCQEVE